MSEMESLNPLKQVRDTCEEVCKSCNHVIINLPQIAIQADDFKEKELTLLRDGVAWDADGWHYHADAKENGPLTAQYVFVLDALNFCFWPVSTLEYDTLAISLNKALTNDSEAFSAENLMMMTEVRNRHSSSAQF